MKWREATDERIYAPEHQTFNIQQGALGDLSYGQGLALTLLN